jgi:hypothetical protein
MELIHDMDDLKVGTVYADSDDEVIGTFIGIKHTFKNCFLQFSEFATGELYQVPASILILGLKKF